MEEKIKKAKKNKKVHKNMNWQGVVLCDELVLANLTDLMDSYPYTSTMLTKKENLDR